MRAEKRPDDDREEGEGVMTPMGSSTDHGLIVVSASNAMEGKIDCESGHEGRGLLFGAGITIGGAREDGAEAGEIQSSKPETRKKSEA